MASENKKTEGSPLSLEENFEKLEELLTVLEKEDVSLEDAFSAYSQGVALVKECNEQIDRVEKRVQVLLENGQTADFE